MADIVALKLPADPERALSLAYAPPAVRPALSMLWRLDERLGEIVARTETPAVGQMQLTWWHEALRNLSTEPQVDPILVEIARTPGIDRDALLPLIDGWEILLDPLPLPDEALIRFAEARGATLFGVAAKLLGHSNAGEAGRSWALVDLAFHVSDRDTARRALALASYSGGRLPKPLAVLTALAMYDRRRGLDKPRRQGAPLRIARAMLAGLTGR
ncbi:MAG: squalene/phytoene synthase family protein [Proteobacteria bacterium]|nr:squalene/phytoene synthase family protein [Pseudomonadota bacterium]